MVKQVKLTSIVPSCMFGKRLDQAIAKMFPNYSRSLIKKWIINRRVYINNIILDKPKNKVYGAEIVSIISNINKETTYQPQNIPLDIIYEDKDIIVLNKPCGLVVHPAIGNKNNTLLNALLHYHPQISNIPRGGIVHRLDKNTTGLMIIAKTIQAYNQLVKLIYLRKIIREYEAIVVGHVTTGGTIRQPISRHPTKRIKMYVNPLGLPAITHYRVLEYFREHTRLRIRLETGRTHQIRVHMSYINHPLVGDIIYGYRMYIPKKSSSKFIELLRKFNNQALHATMIKMNHPVQGTEMKWNVSVPHNMLELINIMRNDLEENKNILNWT